jgi:hypothetical protein
LPTHLYRLASKPFLLNRIGNLGEPIGQIAPAGSVGICRDQVQIPNHLWASTVQDAEGYCLRECRPGHKRMVSENG